mmetsp:Transcript_16786/g.21560  ORF Transcript_16786/g.21560 Transcript_16786/m.21560 type:complete len:110 (-) Transcript_16786:244-573(-)|eukprot:CAMPEP_0117746864 /NCGR_PEP_ID=MMETSP0947-20121206/8185_1 /TAXON_ID=44440 /ORGANISM="Chattonella subsalsa, Strain CCMP2191" /LENGTH=109 /DNA_ID=CAMNT_0005564239 /DNA_START=131 /DNA_END=460 /DNA_ORIENTATION=+
MSLKRHASSDDDSLVSDEEEVNQKKSSSKKMKSRGGRNADGDFLIDLGKNKKCCVRSFKGRTLIDIREYYVDKNSGEEKPGKKGIALQPEQWEALKEACEEIDQAIEEL